MTDFGKDRLCKEGQTMANKLTHAAERAAFQAVIKTAGRKTISNREEGFVSVVDMIQKINGDTWSAEAYDRLRETFGKDGKWTKFFNHLLDYADQDYLEGLFMSFGFEAGFSGYKETKKASEKYGVSIPWVILFDPTSACNLHCTGCWASEYGHQLNLSYEDMDRIVTEGKELGIHGYVMTGGEPTVRKNDVFRLAQKHKDCAFMLFTNGTLVDQDFCDEMKKSRNIVLSMSIEGYEDTTDARRGSGTFRKVMDAMDLLHKNGLVYGTSICYTRENCEAVTSDEFLDFLISKGVAFTWYFHFMPVGMDSSMELVPTPEQREYMYHRVREIRGYEEESRSLPWISRTTVNGSADALPAARTIATSIRTATWSPAFSSIIPVRISTKRAFWSVWSSPCSSFIRRISPSTKIFCSPVPSWKTRRSFRQW